MTHKATLTVSLLALALGGALVSVTARRPAALAATPAPVIPGLATPTPATGGTMASLLNGTLYPATMRLDQMTATYHLIGLVDAQGQLATVATRGETITLAGETFLVGYTVTAPPAGARPPTTPPAQGPPAPPPPAPPAPTLDLTAQLTLVNMRYVQALGGIRDLPTRTNRPATGTEAP